MSLAVQVPTAGIANATEAIKVTNTLTNLSSWANGGIPATDLSPTAGITRSQMAGGFGNLAWSAVSGAVTGVDGRIYNCAPSTVLTLPAPTANRTIGVVAGNAVTGAAPVTINASGGADRLFGVGVNNLSSVVLGTPLSCLIFQADGSNWVAVVGQRDTGWVALTLQPNINAAVGYYTPGVRVQGDILRFRGGVANNTGGTVAGGTLATFPVSMAPISSVAVPGVGLTGPAFVGFSSSGQLTAANLANNAFVYFDGITASLVA